MFATKADMIARFGDREVIALTNRSNTGTIDDAVLQGGLDTADGEISGYLASRYSLPMASVPRLLTGYACDIARYRLCGAAVQCTDDIEERYKMAVRFLEKVAMGQIALGVDATGAVVNAGGNDIQVSAGVRRFDADTLTGY